MASRRRRADCRRGSGSRSWTSRSVTGGLAGALATLELRLDFLLLDLLHHRSIVTHSVLPALAFILLGWRAGAAPIAGALVGIAVHLSCDLLSPMVGYGQIWLPEPYQIPLGPFSNLWLGLNAWLAFIWARRLAVRSLPAPCALRQSAGRSDGDDYRGHIRLGERRGRLGRDRHHGDLSVELCRPIPVVPATRPERQTGRNRQRPIHRNRLTSSQRSFAIMKR